MNRTSRALASVLLAAGAGTLAGTTAFAQHPAEDGSRGTVLHDPSVSEYPYTSYDESDEDMLPTGPVAGQEEAGLFVAATGLAAVGGAGVALTAVWFAGRRRHRPHQAG